MITFPSNPTIGQLHEVGGRSFRFNGTGWVVAAIPGGVVTQTTGQSIADVMSQKAVTDEITGLGERIVDLENNPGTTNHQDMTLESRNAVGAHPNLEALIENETLARAAGDQNLQIQIFANTAIATTSTNGLMASADKTKLDGIAAGANNYTHPATHSATIITQDASNRFVSDALIAAWNGKANAAHSHAQADIATTGWITTALAGKASSAVATTTVNGLMAYADKLKLDGIAANANNYIHPTNHPASIITQDANNRFVTDALIATWNGKANAAHTHAQAEIDSAAGWISTALAGKQAAGSYLTTSGQAYDSARLGGVDNSGYAKRGFVFDGNFNTLRQDGFYEFDGNILNSPIGTPNYRLVSIGERLSVRNTQLAFGYHGNSSTFSFFGRNNDDTGWGEWKEIYHSGNSNKSIVDWTVKDLVAAGCVISRGGDSQYVAQAPIGRAFTKFNFVKHDGVDCAAMHSFDETWEGANINRSGGALNLSGLNGVTLGSWDNPVLVIDQRNMTATVRGTLKSTSCELLNASGVMQYRFSLSGTDCLIANAVGTTIGKIDQSGNLMMKGNITAFATI